MIVSVFALVFGGARDAYAGAATNVVQAKQTALFDALKKSPPDQKKVAALFDEMLDYNALAEASLGAEWAPRSDAEKMEFTAVLKQLVQKAYERNLKKTVNYEINYTGEEVQGPATLVKTTAKSKTNAREEPIEINFKMAQTGGAWKVQDIVTDGSSLVSGWRSQFTKIIKNDGFPTLIRKMKEKLAKSE